MALDLVLSASSGDSLTNIRNDYRRVIDPVLASSLLHGFAVVLFAAAIPQCNFDASPSATRRLVRLQSEQQKFQRLPLVLTSSTKIDRSETPTMYEV